MDETWMIFTLPEMGPSAAELASGAGSAGLRTKETCFGVIAEGEAEAVRGFVESVRRKCGGSVYARRRAFTIEDTEVCASTFRFDKSEYPWLPRFTEQIRRYTS